jgi:parvulin-like peptidyl-prolyl isomerase
VKKIIAIILIGAAITGAVSAQDNLKTAALVMLKGTEPITVKEFQAAVDIAKQQKRTNLTVEEKRQVLDILIDQKLMLQAADRDKITVSAVEIDQQIGIPQAKAQMAQQLGHQPTEVEFAAEFKKQSGGVELAAYREDFRKQLVVKKYIEFKTPDLKNIKQPTDKEISDFYELNREGLVRPATAYGSMIFVPFDAASKSKAKTTAEGLLKTIGSDPDKFDEVAIKGQDSKTEYQAAPFSCPRRPATEEQMGTAFVDAAFNLKQGEVSKLIEANGAYCILKITRRDPFKTLGLTDPSEINGVNIHDYIAAGIYQQKLQEAMQKTYTSILKELREAKTKPFSINEDNIKSVLNS